MELYMEILAHFLAGQRMELSFPDLQIKPERIVEQECYKALAKIKAVIEDDSLEDSECFAKIEEILCIYEEMGSGGGTRHDFG